MMRFTSRDPVRGKQQEPLTLNKYLYCLNNPSNMVDLDGRFAWLAASLMERSLHANLQKSNAKAQKAVFDQSKGQLDAFSMANLQRGAAYELTIASFDGSLNRAIRDGGVKALGLISENLGRIAEIGAELYDDHEQIKNILENSSWGGLIQYGTDKLLDILADPGNEFFDD